VHSPWSEVAGVLSSGMGGVDPSSRTVFPARKKRDLRVPRKHEKAEVVLLAFA